MTPASQGLPRQPGSLPEPAPHFPERVETPMEIHTMCTVPPALTLGGSPVSPGKGQHKLPVTHWLDYYQP